MDNTDGVGSSLGGSSLGIIVVLIVVVVGMFFTFSHIMNANGDITESTTEAWQEILQRESHMTRIEHINPDKPNFDPQKLAEICAALDDGAKENSLPQYVILSDESDYKGEECARHAHEHFLENPDYARRCYNRLIIIY